jgi:hypothetical protein
MKEIIVTTGIVEEVRTFSNFVILFLRGNATDKYQGKLLRYTLGTYNCQKLIAWAQLEKGAEIAVKREQNDNIPKNRTYSFEILKSVVIDMDNI